MNVSIEENYKNEIEQALTEDLLGAGIHLSLELGNQMTNYYVTTRTFEADQEITAEFGCEEKLFQMFMPPAIGKPVLHILGKEGSGKSTFLRFFFGYYLLYRPTLREEGLLLQASHNDLVARHVILYCNLKKCHDEEALLWKTIQKAMHAGLFAFYAKHPELCKPNNLESYDDLWDCIYDLSRHVTNQGERQWFISLIFDNSDLMEEHLQKKLYSYIEDKVPNETNYLHPILPITEDQHALWRIVLTTRPETHANLRISFTPDRYLDTFPLPGLDAEKLLSKRAELVAAKIRASDRHFEQDEFVSSSERPVLIITPPGKAGTFLSDNLRSGIFLEGINEHDVGQSDSGVSSIIADLANGSARRLLKLLPRAKFSPVVRRRLDLCKRNKWTITLRSFYFYWGLICGKDEWRSANIIDNLIPNFYRFGEHPGECYSVFVGLHAISLLSHERGWIEVRKILASLGYRSADIEACERGLCVSEVIKPLWLGPGMLERFQVESKIAAGLFKLLLQRAYTDIMAVDTSRDLGCDHIIIKTDPVDYDMIVDRVASTTHFLEKLLYLESEIYHFDEKQQGIVPSFTSFVDNFKRSGVDKITYLISIEYYRRIFELRKHAQVQAALKNRQDEWQSLKERIKLVYKRAKNLNPWQS